MPTEVVTPTVPYSDTTQRLANGFPDWHVVRRQRASLGGILLNSLGGKPLEDIVNKELPNFFTQRHLASASIFSNYKAFSVDTTKVEISDKPTNYLINSNFSEWQNPTRLPDYWRIDVEDFYSEFFLVQAYARTNYLGGYCLQVQTTNLDRYFPWGEVNIYQEVEIPEDDGATTWSALTHHVATGDEEFIDDTVNFYIQVTHVDGTVKTVISGLKDAKDWRRTTATIEADSKVTKIRVGFKWEPTLATPVFSFLIDNFMLYKGDEKVFWNRNENDKPPFIEYLQTDYTVISSERDGDKSYILSEVYPGEVDKNLLPSSGVLRTSFEEPEEAQPDFVANPVILEPAVWADGTEWEQSAIVVNEPVRQHYNWPTWTLGRLVKFNPNDTTEIFGTYYPSFRIVDPLTEDEENKSVATDLVECNTMTEYNGKLWIFAKVLGGAGLNHVGNFLSMLLVLDNVLPKQEDSFDTDGIDYETTPSYLPIERTYLLDMGTGLGFADFPYADDPYGGNNNPLRLPCQYINFIDTDKMEVRMQFGYQGILDLKFDYFTKIDGDGEIVVLRDYKSDEPNSSLIVC